MSRSGRGPPVMVRLLGVGCSASVTNRGEAVLVAEQLQRRGNFANRVDGDVGFVAGGGGFAGVATG